MVSTCNTALLMEQAYVKTDEACKGFGIEVRAPTRDIAVQNGRAAASRASNTMALIVIEMIVTVIDETLGCHGRWIELSKGLFLSPLLQKSPNDGSELEISLNNGQPTTDDLRGLICREETPVHLIWGSLSWDEMKHKHMRHVKRIGSRICVLAH